MCIITMFHAFSFVFTLLQWLCAVRFGLGWAHDVFKFACHTFMHFHAYIPSSFYILIYIYIYIYIIFLVLFWLSLSLSLSPPLSLFLAIVALWHPNANPLRLRTLFILGHLLPLTPLHLTFGSVMRRPSPRRTFHDATFIQNTKSFYQTFQTLTYPRSSTEKSNRMTWHSEWMPHLEKFSKKSNLAFSSWNWTWEGVQLDGEEEEEAPEWRGFGME